jgi:hypothetical protein
MLELMSGYTLWHGQQLGRCNPINNLNRIALAFYSSENTSSSIITHNTSSCFCLEALTSLDQDV